MPETEISSTVASDIANTETTYSVDSQQTDAADGQNDTTWQMEDWPQNLGYYLEIPELQTAVDAKATWTMGAGFEAEETVKMLLGNIKGNGKDSFNDIISNMIRTYTIAGDAFAEIIRDKDGILVNLKPLDPSTVVIVQSNKGRIKRYEYIAKTKDPKKKYNPKKILHLSRKRIADSIHGISVIPSCEMIIKMRNEAMTDWRTALHRNIHPLWIFHLDTDDQTKIDGFKAKMDGARATGENMYVPKGAVVPELQTVGQNSTLNPLAWIDRLNDYFFQAVNVPQIIIGNAKEFTDASGKIVYLSYEQSVKGEQLYVEEQILGQLNLEIQLTFPASLQNDLVSDDQKDPMTSAASPNDTTAEVEGPT